MGLFPLEFTDCLQDSPYFRDSLHSHEKELERTSNNIKELVKEVKNLLQAAKRKSGMKFKKDISDFFPLFKLIQVAKYLVETSKWEFFEF
jgi:hypothetical protein